MITPRSFLCLGPGCLFKHEQTGSSPLDFLLDESYTRWQPPIHVYQFFHEIDTISKSLEARIVIPVHAECRKVWSVTWYIALVGWDTWTEFNLDKTSSATSCQVTKETLCSVLFQSAEQLQHHLQKASKGINRFISVVTILSVMQSSNLTFCMNWCAARITCLQLHTS